MQILCKFWNIFYNISVTFLTREFGKYSDYIKIFLILTYKYFSIILLMLPKILHYLKYHNLQTCL